MYTNLELIQFSIIELFCNFPFAGEVGMNTYLIEFTNKKNVLKLIEFTSNS